MFRYNESGPLRAAIHMTLDRAGLSSYDIILGGGELAAKFQLKKFLNLEDRINGTDEAEVVVKIKPADVTFPPNKSVTEWRPISSQFPEIHITQGAGVDWNSKQVLTRLRLRANESKEGSSPALLLESLVLDSGTWEGVPETKKNTLSRSGSLAISLWSANCAWYSPLPQHKLPTAPGILLLTADVPLPGEVKYRWFLQAILRRMDRGKSAASRQDFEAYLEKPYMTDNPGTTLCWLPNLLSMPVDSSNTSGNSATPQSHFTRKGRVIYRYNPSQSKSLKIKPPKFNSVQKGEGLAVNALPEDAPNHLMIVARKMFNASLAASSSKSYESVIPHIRRLETELGRTFKWPLAEQDFNLLLVHLLSKGLQPGTVRSYLAGARRIALAKGVPTPSHQSDLSKTILRGYENLMRNPVKAVAEAKHRPVSIPFLRLLGHAANKYWKGNLNDKQCFWVVAVISFWGSLRLGEVLCEEVQAFSPLSDLLGTDVILMSATSLALWIRDPKVPKKFGDVVEIWSTPAFPDIDPVLAFSAYWERRKDRFPLSYPLFLAASGKIFTHSLFNATLQALISHFSVELELSVNKWTGHSFRSGLPTLLQSAGFKEEDIKAWGRWVSDAFQAYTKDMTRRLEVQRTMSKAMSRLKAFVEGQGSPDCQSNVVVQ